MLRHESVELSDSEVRVDGLVEVLADCGGLAARLVEIHRDDGAGRCVVCSEGNQSARRPFPCTLRSLAVRALHLQAERAAGTALPKRGPGPAV